MTLRTWILKVLCTASMLAGTMLVGLPVFAQGIPGTGTVTNSAPVISLPAVSPIYTATTVPTSDPANDVAFTDWVNANAVLNVHPANGIEPVAGQSVFVFYRFSVTDPEGSSDIQDAKAQLLKPDGSVHTAYAAAKPLGTSSPLTKEYYAQFELKHYDPPATGANVYKVVVKASDAAAIQSGVPVDTTLTPKLFNYNLISGLKAQAAAINFGNLPVNGKSQGIPVTLVNTGNVRVDSTLLAADLAKGLDKIPAAKIWYGPTASAVGTNFPAAGSTAKRDVGFNLEPGASRTIYLAVEVPAGTPAGLYTTTLTFGGVDGSSDTCSGSDCASVTWSG